MRIIIGRIGAAHTWTIERARGLSMFAKLVSILVAGLILCGCSVARQEQEQETDADLAVETEANAAVDHCNGTYKEGDRAVILERAKCLNDAVAKLRPLKRFPDLLDVDAANRLAVAGKEQKGRITHIDAMQQFASMHSKVLADEQRRMSANTSGREQGLSAAAMPVACTRYGDTATCY
jgi:hypothetical protein